MRYIIDISYLRRRLDERLLLRLLRLRVRDLDLRRLADLLRRRLVEL